MLREDEFHEFKKTTGELNQAMISVSAMLNKHKQGIIYFGLKNNGTPVPFEISDSTLRDVSRKVFEAIRPQIFPEIHTEVIHGCEVIVLSFSGEDVPYSAYGRYYIRTADEDRELSPSELRKIMIGHEYEENWENRTTKESLEDADEKTVKAFYESASACGRMPVTGYDKEKILRSIGAVNGDHLTNAGRVLFSSRKPIALKMAVFATDHKETFLDIAASEGNIFQLIDEAVHFILRNIRWRAELSEDGIHRKEIPEIPLDAIREAVINSFAHARYDLPVQHEIDIYSNRISICNPGSFANDFEPIDFYTRDICSYLRNEVIAKTLYLCKDVESFGSGIRKIYTLCNEADVAISWSDEETAFTLEFSRADRNQLASGLRNKPGLSEAEHTILFLLDDEPSLTNAELARKSGKSERTVSRIIAMLKNKKLIRRYGSKKTGYWIVL